MICLICRQAELVEGLTPVKFERDEIVLTVDNVPARLCPSCREAYLDEDIALHLLRMAKEIFQTGAVEPHYEYKGAEI